MDPIKISQQLQQTLVSYLGTSFDVNKDGNEIELAQALRRSFDSPGALFKGPYLELTPPYKTGRSLDQLAQSGVISPRLLDLPCFSHGKPLPTNVGLYTHQETAIQRLVSGQRNIVVSSGTGSGKTECFLLPILNDLLLDSAPGVRAVIIYPLNALVNDQLRRLRSILDGTDITFGRYTGELPNTTDEGRKQLQGRILPNEIISREMIWAGQLPQILITNYAMLEYLLLRPDDAVLFKSGLWKFIVLDEAHTYTGAQGVEVAHLIRRLKHRLGHDHGEMRCIATSATLTNDDATAAVSFASALFGEHFEQQDIIFGQPDHDYIPAFDKCIRPSSDAYLSSDLDDLLNNGIHQNTTSVAEVAVLLEQLGIIEEAEAPVPADIAVGDFLWRALGNNEHFQQLRAWMLRNGKPVLLDNAASHLFGEMPIELSRVAIYRLIELCAMARPDEDTPPLLPARYHLFARPPQGAWACINPNCPGRPKNSSAVWSRLFTSKRKTCDICDAVVFPLSVCRTCGQVYLQLRKEERGSIYYLDETESDDNTVSEYYTWSRIDENAALQEEKDDDIETVSDKQFSQEPIEFCVFCGQPKRRCRCKTDSQQTSVVVLYQIREGSTRRKAVKYEPVNKMNECPRCRDTGIRDTEIATPFSLGRSIMPLAVLAEELYRNLPASSDPLAQRLPGQGRKLLSFYDNRQGAARFAAYLQDVANQKTYRHVIPNAIRQLVEKDGYWPDFASLVEQCFDIAMRGNLFHNDPTLEIKPGQHLSRPEEKRCRNRIAAEIIAEFTTRRQTRTSLEGLGLVSVEYFEPGREPDFSEIAERVQMSPEKMRILIEFLLDDLRRQKIIELPDGVEAKHTVFGRHKGDIYIVRGGNYGPGEVLWIGKTEHHRRKDFVRSVLRHESLDASETSIVAVLSTLWEWLTTNGYLEDFGGGRFKLSYNRMFFRTDADWHECSQCHRLTARGEFGVCPFPNCEGSLGPVSDVVEKMESNFYYRSFIQNLLPVRVEEHTAQLEHEKGARYQKWFKDGYINILSCSTTFEMGIDLGDLQAVVLSNVPPTVANYKQRSGRAGRRASGTAFILTWASERPHDQAYFDAPIEIIDGSVRIPYVALDNRYIRQRHVNAILLSEFLRFKERSGRNGLQHARVGDFFGEQQADSPSLYPDLQHWTEIHHDSLQSIMSVYASLLGSVPYADWLKDYLSKMHDVAKSYNDAVAYYLEAQDRASHEKQWDEGKQYEKLLKRLNDDYLINFLSTKGVLPSYSFPLDVVELQTPANETRLLRLHRAVKLAIREYAPGSEVVADKRIWKSGGLQFYKKTPKKWKYMICKNCNHLVIAQESGLPLPGEIEQNYVCPVCGQNMRGRGRGGQSVTEYLVPDGFRCTSDSGASAGQYVHREPNRYRYALRPAQQLSEEAVGSILRVASEPNGELLYVNEGVWGTGFRVCMRCGNALQNRRSTSCKLCGGPVETLALGFKESTNTLHLRFQSTQFVSIPGPEKQSFWLSLMYALIHGASRVLQIERRDIDGVLSPRQIDDGWEQSVVLFDNVPGGAGHVQQIRQNLHLVVEEAIRIANCPDCAPETSCYHCLRDYNNQFFHHLLERGEALRFLEALRASLEGQEQSGINEVIAVDQHKWLLRTMGQSKKELFVAVPQIRDGNWLDVFYSLLLRPNARVHLFVMELPSESDNEGLVIRRYLQTLIDKGLIIYRIDFMPEWEVVIDSSEPLTCRAIRHLGRLADEPQSDNSRLLETTVNPDEVQKARKAFADIKVYSISSDELGLPANVEVRRITQFDRIQHESELFAEIFENSVIRMRVNDRYLHDEYQIVDRLGSYIEMASQGGALKSVDVYTTPKDYKRLSQEQKRASDKLVRRYPCVEFHYNRWQTEHDRFVHCYHKDGTETRIVIGVGLDFIRPDGSVRATHIVIERIGATALN